MRANLFDPHAPIGAPRMAEPIPLTDQTLAEHIAAARLAAEDVGRRARKALDALIAKRNDYNAREQAFHVQLDDHRRRIVDVQRVPGAAGSKEAAAQVREHEDAIRGLSRDRADHEQTERPVLESLGAEVDALAARLRDLTRGIDEWQRLLDRVRSEAPPKPAPPPKVAA